MDPSTVQLDERLVGPVLVVIAGRVVVVVVVAWFCDIQHFIPTSVSLSSLY